MVSLSVYPLCHHRLRTRGVALLATVLVGALAASIVLLLVNVSVADMRAASALGEQQSAEALAESAVSELAAELRSNPTAYLEQVRPKVHSVLHERARVCLSRPGAPVVQPGNLWPADCGAVWDYTEPVSQGPSDDDVRFEYRPPSPQNPYLGVDVVASVGDATVARHAEFTQLTPADWTLHSDSDVYLSYVNFHDGSLSGTVPDPNTPAFYSATMVEHLYTGRYSAPTGVVVSEGTPTRLDAWGVPYQFDNPPGWRGYYPGAFADGTPRDVTPQPLRSVALAANAEFAANLACSTLNEPRPLTGTDRVTQLCVGRGALIYDIVSGAAVRAPQEARRWMLVPRDQTGVAVLDIYWSDSTNWGAAAGGVLSEPSPTETQGHPGEVGFDTSAGRWQLLATSHYPASGVAVFDGDTVIGACAAAEGATAPGYRGGGDCRQWGPAGSEPGAWFAASLTVIVGTPNAAADAWIGGPVRTAGDAKFGLFTYGSVLLPVWAHPPGADLVVTGHLSALGRTSRPAGYTGSAVGVWPSITVDHPGNKGTLLRIVGGLSTPSTPDLRQGGIAGTGVKWAEVRVESEPQKRRTPSPHYPAFDPTWRLHSSHPVGPSDVCGTSDPQCTGFLDTTATAGTNIVGDRPGAPEILSAAADSGVLKLAWGHPAGSKAVSYEVLYSAGSAPETAVAADPGVVCADQVCRLDVTSGVVNGTTYNMAVVAVDANHVRSQRSVPVALTPTGVPDPPTNVTVALTNNKDGVVVNWKAPNTAVAQYQVLWRVKGAGGWQGPFLQTDPERSSLELAGIASGATYEFRVFSVGSQANVSGPSATAELTVPVGRPYSAQVSLAAGNVATLSWLFDTPAGKPTPAKTRLYWSRTPIRPTDSASTARLVAGTNYPSTAASPGPTGGSHTIGAMPAGSRWWVWVVSESAANVQSPAAIAQFDVLASTPTGVTAEATAPGTVKVTWDRTDEVVDQWVVTVIGGGAPKVVAAYSNETTIAELGAGRVQVKVQAVNGAGTSAATNPVQVDLS